MIGDCDRALGGRPNPPPGGIPNVGETERVDSVFEGSTVECGSVLDIGSGLCDGGTGTPGRVGKSAAEPLDTPGRVGKSVRTPALSEVVRAGRPVGIESSDERVPKMSFPLSKLVSVHAATDDVKLYLRHHVFGFFLTGQ